MTDGADRRVITDEELNAYVDHALDRDDAARIARAAAADPAVAERIARLQRLKSAVAALATDAAPPAVPLRPRPEAGSRKVGSGLWIAAMTAIAGIVLWQHLTQPPVVDRSSGPVLVDEMLTGLVAGHDAWSSLSGDYPEAPTAPVWLDEVMEATGLALVHRASLVMPDGAEGWHFAFVGPSRCQLSLFAIMRGGGERPLAITLEDDLLIARWAEVGEEFTVIARKLDRLRFATIATALNEATRKRAPVTEQMLSDLRGSRRPCIG